MFVIGNENLVAIGSAIGGGVTVFTMVGTAMARCYRRCAADEALVKTGGGGNKVYIGGGTIVLPVVHQLLRVSLRSVKLIVERSGKNALVTGDKIKANVTTELYIKVEPIKEDVLAAARSFGERNLDERAIGDLIEGKLTDALRSVAANQTFMSLHGKRKEFAEHIQLALSEELKKNGLTLENVSITALAMVPVKDLDEHDVFDAEGLRAITESVQTNREKTNQIQREKENQIQAQNVEARMRSLQLEQQEKQAEADQARKVAEYGAMQAAETAKAVYIQEQSRDLGAYEKMKAVETARIQGEQAIAVAMAMKVKTEREAQIAAEKGQQQAEIEKQKVVQAAEIDRQKALEAATIEKEKVVGAALIAKEQAIEVARIGKQIAVTKSEEEEARAGAAKALAKAEEEKARQAIVAVESTAKAEREKITAVIQAEMRLVEAEREAEATLTRANAIAKKMEVEAAARSKVLEAENSVSTKLLLRDVTLKALEVMPELMHELMTPANAIKEIRVLQTGGAGFSNGGGGGLGAMSPILRTVLEAGAAYPMLKEVMNFAKIDGNVLGAKAQEVLGELSGELSAALAKDNGTTNAAPAPAATPAAVPAIADAKVALSPKPRGLNGEANHA